MFEHVNARDHTNFCSYLGGGPHAPAAHTQHGPGTDVGGRLLKVK